jgi:hypothetical protein
MRPRLVNDRLFFGIWLILISLVIFSLRFEGLPNIPHDSDLATYVYNMSLTTPSIPYHQREFVFWLGQKYLYMFAGNSAVVFIVFDFILALAFYRSINLLREIISPKIDLRNLRYLYFSIFLFFPVFTGMHNQYRLSVALMLSICAIGYSKDKFGKGSFVFVLSVFTHNAVLLLTPIFLLVANNYRYKKLAPIATLLMFLALHIVLNNSNDFIKKSIGLDIGQKLPYFYFGALLIIALIISMCEYAFRSWSHSTLLKIITFCVIILLFAMVKVNSQISERIFFMIMTVLFPLIGVYVEDRFKPKIITRLGYLHLTFSPLLFLYNGAIPLPF